MPEVAEEKQGQQPPVPSPAAGAPRRVFEKLARLWAVTGTVCWVFSLAFLLRRWNPLGGGPLRWGRLELGLVGVGIGAAVGIAGLVVFLRRFGGQLDWHKSRQATAVRAAAFVFVAALTFYGSFAFYQIPSTTSGWWEDLVKFELFGKVIALKPVLFPSAGVFLTVMMTAYVLLNRPKWAEFLIETEGELKKVSWPHRKEYVGSAVVVVVVVVVISLFLFFVDQGLSKLMKWWGMGF